MKSFNKIIITVTILLIVLWVGANWMVYSLGKKDVQRQYRVEAGRIAADIENYGFEGIDIQKYSMISGVYELAIPQAEGTDSKEFFDSNRDYVIKQVGNKLYRIEYVTYDDSVGNTIIMVVNVVIAVMAAVVIGVLLYVRQKILKPFDTLKEVPYQLSKGNLTIPVKESKNRFFGRFVWGVDLLRERMEEQKQRELELQKERKTLVLALSHDIKTPLSAIKLYAKALSKGLYSDVNKQTEIADNINLKADEIEGYVSDIIRASKEDFVDLTVNMGEVYMSQVIENIRAYYMDKLSVVKTEFRVEEYSDCLIKGDTDRLVEVLQNIMENAIKYGDGKSIEITFEAEEDCRLITVTNTGATLEESELSHIFESFWRGSNASGNKGSGLGLYICKKLMQAMDGEVYAHLKDDSMCVTVVTRLA